MDPEQPRAMRAPAVRASRLAAIREPHVAPLNQYVDDLRRRTRLEVPWIDPADGGVNARILFLLEKPGPMTSTMGKKAGSGFISSDNDDPSAENSFLFWQRVGMPRSLVARWNVIPGWNGTRKITTSELDAGVGELKTLLPLLPEIRSVVFVGKQAAKAAKLVRRLGDFHFFESAHPSRLVEISPRPHVRKAWREIPDVWREAANQAIL